MRLLLNIAYHHVIRRPVDFIVEGVNTGLDAFDVETSYAASRGLFQ